MPLEPHPTDPSKLIMRAGNYNLPVAVHQFRAPHCADWYDGIPDHHDGHGPYEVRTLYTAPPLPVQEPVIFYRCKGCDHAYEGIPPSSCDCAEKTGFTRVEYFTIPPLPVQERNT